MLREAKLGRIIAMQMKDLSLYEWDVISKRRYRNKFVLRFLNPHFYLFNYSIHMNDFNHSNHLI